MASLLWLLLLAPLSTLNPFNLKTHLNNANLSPVYTIQTLFVFLHISYFPPHYLHLATWAIVVKTHISTFSLVIPYSVNHVVYDKGKLIFPLPPLHLMQISPSSSYFLGVEKKRKKKEASPFCFLISAKWVLHALRKQRHCVLCSKDTLLYIAIESQRQKALFHNQDTFPIPRAEWLLSYTHW